MQICYDGLNLSRQRGTGIATYTRMLARTARELEHGVGVVYSVPTPLPKNPELREISFYDPEHATSVSRLQRQMAEIADHFRCYLSIKPTVVPPTGIVFTEEFSSRLPAHDFVYATRNLFSNANWYFRISRRMLNLNFERPPDVLHCTYQMPLRCKSARNVYTIHDLIPLRLPYATLDNKRMMFRLLRTIARTADHIVTVSENSRQDIIRFLGVEERRVTNTFESVAFPAEFVNQPVDAVAESLAGSLGLEFGRYLLFYSALEPKKNVRRLIEAYLFSGIDLPLIVIASGGWGNEAETTMLRSQREQQRAGLLKRRIHQFDYVSLGMLVSLIRGARAVIFPSLYEGFGLPVLEAMVLGTPVVTSRASSLPEIAGDAALLVDPYDVGDIARGIRTIAEDADLRAELIRRGRTQAEFFSPERYRERVAQLYNSLR
ncbi:MAG: glycosyltransferase family 4 protein [Alphaproteobacteria bacterium]|nr:glycosyltransferase family 4 protein [Alphaproteobacteria bacterium]